MSRSLIENLESRQMLCGGAAGAMVAGAAATPTVHASVIHRHRSVASVLSLLGNYNTTVTIRGVPVHLSLNVDHQHLGHVSGTLDATNVPIVGDAHIDFTGVVNADNTFTLSFTGSATGNASGSFTSDYKSATVTYNFTAAGMTFKGTRTFTR